MSGGIFINYRRGDDPGFTGRLFDQLAAAFPRDKLFMDVDSIAPGADFSQVLRGAVDECDVLLAVVGRGWLSSTDKHGDRRLDKPGDFVRIEIAEALAAGKLVIPVLVNGADVPNSLSLPAEIKEFSRRNAVRISHERFHTDAQTLIKSLTTILADAEERRKAGALRSAADKATHTKEIAKHVPELETVPRLVSQPQAAPSPRQIRATPLLFILGGAALVVLIAGAIFVDSKRSARSPQAATQPATLPNSGTSIQQRIQTEQSKGETERARMQRDFDEKMQQMFKDMGSAKK
jgi:TIR domain-containing protein